MRVSFLDIVNNSKQLIISPKLFWISKKEDLDSQTKLMLGYLLPLIAVVAIAVFIGEFFGSSDFYVGTALLKSLRVIVLFLLQYLIATFFTNGCKTAAAAADSLDRLHQRALDWWF